MEVFLSLLKSPDFAGKLLLLLVTAALTGILVPEISAQLSETRFKEQKVFEAELLRQQKILSSQNELLNTLSEELWEFQLLNINVSFYKLNGDEESYKKAVESYQNKSAISLGKIRTDLSKSKRLVSPTLQNKLSNLYFNTLLSIDADLEALIKKGVKAKRSEWAKQHDKSFGESQKKIDNFLTELALELKLSASYTLSEDASVGLKKTHNNGN